MKKIFTIWLAFVLMWSMITIVGQVTADNSNPNMYFTSESGCNWTIMDDFFDAVHGRVRIHGKVLGYYNSENDDSSARPLEKASVSISLISSESNNFLSDVLEIPSVIPIPDWESYIETPWSSDDSSMDINLTYVDDMISDLIDINFSSMYVKKPSFKKYINEYTTFEEIHVTKSPSSSINDIINCSWANKLYLWRHTFTDKNGEFDFDFLQPGTYEIKASKMGYESLTKTVTIDDKSAEVNFLLNATAISYVFDEILLSENVSFENISQYFKTRMQIDNATINGKVGCRIVINKNIGNYVHIYNDGLTIKATNITDNKISVKISGNDDVTGKTIEINVHGDIFYDPNNLIIEYDGEGIRMADDLKDVLNPDDDGSHPEYWIIYDANGTHILVSIPHFSEHEITVYSLAPVTSISSVKAASDILLIMAVYIVICTIAAIIFVGSIGLRKRIR